MVTTLHIFIPYIIYFLYSLPLHFTSHIMLLIDIVRNTCHGSLPLPIFEWKSYSLKCLNFVTYYSSLCCMFTACHILIPRVIFCLLFALYFTSLIFLPLAMGPCHLVYSLEPLPLKMLDFYTCYSFNRKPRIFFLWPGFIDFFNGFRGFTKIFGSKNWNLGWFHETRQKNKFKLLGHPAGPEGRSGGPRAQRGDREV